MSASTSIEAGDLFNITKFKRVAGLDVEGRPSTSMDRAVGQQDLCPTALALLMPLFIRSQSSARRLQRPLHFASEPV
jgi:hypothetical protein